MNQNLDFQFAVYKSQRIVGQYKEFTSTKYIVKNIL